MRASAAAGIVARWHTGTVYKYTCAYSTVGRCACSRVSLRLIDSTSILDERTGLPHRTRLRLLRFQQACEYVHVASGFLHDQDEFLRLSLPPVALPPVALRGGCARYSDPVRLCCAYLAGFRMPREERDVRDRQDELARLRDENVNLKRFNLEQG